MCKGGKASQIHCATKARGQLCNAVHRIQQLVSVQHSPKYLHLSLEIVLLRSSFYSSVFLDLNIIDSGSRKQRYHAGSILISVMDYWQQLHIRTFFIVSLFSGLFFFCSDAELLQSFNGSKWQLQAGIPLNYYISFGNLFLYYH